MQRRPRRQAYKYRHRNRHDPMQKSQRKIEVTRANVVMNAYFSFTRERSIKPSHLSMRTVSHQTLGTSSLASIRPMRNGVSGW